MSEAKVIKLKYPFQYGEETVEEFELPRLRGEHILHIGAAPTMKDLIIAAQKATGKAPSFFKKMDAADLMDVQEVVADFLGLGQETGES